MTKERNIYLIRHLSTSMNKSGTYMGRGYDPSIIGEGKLVLEGRLNFLRNQMNLNSPRLYSSPAKRCLETMELVKSVLDITNSETLKDERLLETDFGNASGLTVAEIRIKYPEVYNAWVTDQSKTVFPGGETYQDVQKRVWNAISEILESSKDASSVLICTHVDVMKMLLFKVLDISISNKSLVIMPNGSVCVLAYNGEKLKLAGLFT